MGRMDRDRTKRGKPRFLTQSPKQYLTQIDSVMLDRELSIEQKKHAINSIRRESLRTYGFYHDAFKQIDRAISEALEQCEKCGEV